MHISEISGLDRWKEMAGPSNYNVRELARLCGLSCRQLQREFRRHLDRTPQDWLNEQRMIVAGEMLLAGDPIKKVAADLGFKQTSHFYRHFKLHCRMTPAEFVASNFGHRLSAIGDVHKRTSK